MALDFEWKDGELKRALQTYMDGGSDMLGHDKQAVLKYLEKTASVATRDGQYQNASLLNILWFVSVVGDK